MVLLAAALRESLTQFTFRMRFLGLYFLAASKTVCFCGGVAVAIPGIPGGRGIPPGGGGGGGTPGMPGKGGGGGTPGMPGKGGGGGTPGMPGGGGGGGTPGMPGGGGGGGIPGKPGGGGGGGMPGTPAETRWDYNSTFRILYMQWVVQRIASRFAITGGLDYMYTVLILYRIYS